MRMFIKRGVLFLLLVGVLLVSGCGVSFLEYNKIRAENRKLVKENEELLQENLKLVQEYSKPTLADTEVELIQKDAITFRDDSTILRENVRFSQDNSRLVEENKQLKKSHEEICSDSLVAISCLSMIVRDLEKDKPQSQDNIRFLKKISSNLQEKIEADCLKIGYTNDEILKEIRRTKRQLNKE